MGGVEVCLDQAQWERCALSVSFGAGWGDAGLCPGSRLVGRHRDYVLNSGLGVGWDGGAERKVCPESWRQGGVECRVAL